MLNLKTVFVLVFLGIFAFESIAQNRGDISRAALLKELESRNIDYDEARQRLLDEGYDIDTLDINSLSLEERQRLENVLLDLSKEAPVLSDISKEERIQPEEAKPQAIVKESPPTVQSQNTPVTIYGQDLFRNAIVSVISASNQIKAPESYVLGQGDQLVISIWGRSQLESSYIIAEDGYIRILDGRIRVFLKGLNLAEARAKLESILRREYSFEKGEFEIAVNFSRTVRIGIFGEVFGRAGSFTISGFNTALNALSLVGGPSDIGSLRNIVLQKSDGSTFLVDVYEFMKNPGIQQSLYLDDNDIILIPVSDKVVNLKGAVRRPFKYELRSEEGLAELIEFAGGFTEDAYLKKLQIKRFRDGKQIIIDVDWTEIENANQNVALRHGDVITVENIERSYRNFVSISGELDKPGQYERIPNMRLLDLVLKAGLTPNSNTDLIYLIRTNANGTNELIRINLAEILNDPQLPENLLLNDLDKVEVWSRERFADLANISVSGAVRFNGIFPYDQQGSVRVTDAVLLAGGLRRDASNFATIHYNDPLNKKKKYYKTIDNLLELFDNPEDNNNFILSPFDSLHIQSINTIEEKLFVRIEGAVNVPGQYQYGEEMTLKDLMIMAGGLQLDASTSDIEVSRVIIRDNEPTRIVVANLEMDRDYKVLSKGTANGEYLLEPYDNVAVRFIRDFDFQDRVFLSGEFKVPGPYAIYEENLRIASLIQKAGGLTAEAFPEGATLVRNENQLGPIVIKLDEILRNPGSEYNFILKNGDEINVPKVKEFITIRGATRVDDLVLSDNIGPNNQIRVPFMRGKDAAYYINEFAGGFDETADKKNVFVEYPNGEIKHSKPGLFGRRYPRVTKGSTITVATKEQTPVEKSDQSDTDWSKVLSDSVGQALSILTLILLIQRID